MDRLRMPRALATIALLAGCSAPGEAQRPGAVAAAVGKVVEALAAETSQRANAETFRGLPVVVRTMGTGAAEAVIAEALRTRLVERGSAVEVACPAKCLEVSLLEFVVDAAAQPALSAGQVLATGGAAPPITGLPRTERDLATGQAAALLVTFAARDGNRYNARQQVVAVVAVAGAPAAR
jgi:hypothetical protein